MNRKPKDKDSDDEQEQPGVEMSERQIAEQQLEQAQVIDDSEISPAAFIFE